MNLLGLCQEVHKGTGHAGQITTVVGMRGVLGRIPGWVRDAYLDIQRMPYDFKWMRQTDFTGNLSPGKKRYTPADFALTRVRKYDMDSIYVYDIDIGSRDSTRVMDVKDYGIFAQQYLGAGERDGRPRFVTSPNNTDLIFSPTPDSVLIASFDYYLTPQVLEADTDVPEMPEHYHGLIVQGALMKYGGFDDAPEVVLQAEKEYNRIIRDLYREQAVINKRVIRMRPIA